MTSVLTHTESGCDGGRDGELLRVQLAGNADAAGRARRELARLRTDLDPPLLESVRLLVTELVTNSIRHADAAAMELAVAVSDRDVHVEVANPGGGFEPRPSGPKESDSGWGLFLVDRLSDDWGVAQDPRSGYQRVWFAIARA